MTAVGDIQAGDPFAVTVEARDGNNTIAENFNATVGLDAAASGGSNFTVGTASTAAAAGTATFNGLVLNNAADNYAVTASTAGPFSGISNGFNVTASHLAVLPVANVRAGDPFNVTVEARDADNAVAENFTAIVSLSAAAVGGSNFVGGTATLGAHRRLGHLQRPGPQQCRRQLRHHRQHRRPRQRLTSFNVTAHHLTVVTSVANSAGRHRLLGDRPGPRRQQRPRRELQRQRRPRRRGHRRLQLLRGHRRHRRHRGRGHLRRPDPQQRRRRLPHHRQRHRVRSGVSNTFAVTASHLNVQPVGNIRSGDAFATTVQALDANNAVAENFTGGVGLGAVVPAGGSGFAAPPAPHAGAGVSSSATCSSSTPPTATPSPPAPPASTTAPPTASTSRPGSLIVLPVANVRAGDPFNVTVQARDANHPASRRELQRQRRPRRRGQRRLQLRRGHRRHRRHRGQRPPSSA